MKTMACLDCGGHGEWDEGERAVRCGRCRGTGLVAADASAIPSIAGSDAPLLERCNDVMAALFRSELDVRDVDAIGEMFASTEAGEADFLAFEAAFNYLFTNSEKDTAVVVFKGTSLYWDSSANAILQTNDEFTAKSPMSSNDRFNDNLFFSCCFYKQSTLFPACNACQEDNYQKQHIKTDTCCKQCYQDIKNDPMNYINKIREIIGVVETYIDLDKTDVYFTGHSLGGMLASIASLMYNRVAITFEVPGDGHYLSLGLGHLEHAGHNAGHKVYHFGHNADPIFMGSCGMTCSILGYNVNTKCHSGYTCSYDSKTKLGYTESVFNHRIEYVIKHVIPNWQSDMPQCIQDTECTECETWTYV